MKYKWGINFVRVHKSVELLPSIYLDWNDTFWIWISFLFWVVNIYVFDPTTDDRYDGVW